MVYFGLVSLYSSQIFNCGSITKSGKPQAVIVWVIELIYLVILIWIRPFMDKRTNAFNITIGVINFINALFSCFLKCFQTTKCRVISYGGGVFHIECSICLVLLLFTIITCVLALLYKNPDTRYQPMKDDRVSFLPRFGNKSGGGDATKGPNSNSEDMELMALGATAMKGHEHSNQQGGTVFDDYDSYDEDSPDHRSRNASGPGGGFNHRHLPIMMLMLIRVEIR